MGSSLVVMVFDGGFGWEEDESRMESGSEMLFVEGLSRLDVPIIRVVLQDPLLKHSNNSDCE